MRVVDFAIFFMAFSMHLKGEAQAAFVIIAIILFGLAMRKERSK